MIFLRLEFNIIDVLFYISLYNTMNNKIINKKKCNINHDLLLNCVIKSQDLNECHILKIIYNEFCYKNKINYSTK